MFRVDPLGNGYRAAEAKSLIRRLLTRVRGLSDVEQAGVSRWEMLRGSGWANPVTVVSDERIVTDNTAMNAVSPGFFESLGVAVTRGRDFDGRDARDGSRWALRSAIINEEFVRRYFGDRDPIGARIAIGEEPGVATDITVVGVVKTFHDFRLREREPQVFFALWERSVGEGTFYVRARGSSGAAARSIRAAVKELDPQLAVLSLRTLDDQIDRMLSSERMLATLAGAFASSATLLAMVGLYGVLSFAATLRTKEIGIRFALGAPRWAAGGSIVREAALLAVAGWVIAMPATWVLGRLVESQLFGVRPMDMVSITGSAAVLTLVCLGASAVVARRINSSPPLEALRIE